MSNKLTPFGTGPARPLSGLTVLLVEDSRYASEAVRLMCLRLGARIRRADSICTARRHLQIYHPSVAIVDLGLPDGAGEDLIKALTSARPRIGVVLGISGDSGGRDRALAAGADGFLAKPIAGLAAFQQAILSHLPPHHRTRPVLVTGATVAPDPLAEADDLRRAAALLDHRTDAETLDYLLQFLTGLARVAGDATLGKAAADLTARRQCGDTTAALSGRLSRLLQARMAEMPDGWASRPAAGQTPP